MKLKFRIKRKSLNKTIWYILVISLLFVSIGYSYIKTTLSIGGNVKFDESITYPIILGKKMAAYSDNTFSEYVTSSTGINFRSAPSDTNGKGLYLRAGTENNQYPIYYYRGEVDNNNVLFGGFCWKIVRTTEKGGTKLIYNGTLNNHYTSYQPMIQSEYKNVTNDEKYPFTFNSSTKKWTSNVPQTSSTSTDWNNKSSINLSVPSNGIYVFEYTVSSYSGNYMYFYLNGTEMRRGVGEKTEQISLYLKTSDVIKVEYRRYYSTSAGSNNVVFSLNKGVGSTVKSCDNLGEPSQLSGKSGFNSGKELLKFGYMYGTFSYSSTSWSDTEYVYGSDVTYNTSTKVYTLTTPSSSSKFNSNKNKHYTCKLTTNGTCSTVYYVYKTDYYGSHIYALELTNGKKLENVINEAFTNTNDSEIKTKIDDWFKYNVLKYLNKLEDSVWCNDRTIASGGYLKEEYIGSSGSFGARNSSSPSLNDSIVCPNINDRFTVSDTAVGNGKLTYPVGLLTEEEAIVAGSGGYGRVWKTYLYAGESFWTMSPEYLAYYGLYDSIFYTYDPTGDPIHKSTTQSLGVRPSIVLKSGTVATSGNGTATNPYVVE